MRLYPAIDLLGGRCVRLYQGDYERSTTYGADPVAQAGAFVAEGAEVLHIVDLDAAKSGEPVNRPVIAEVCRSVEVPVQVGGGVRDRVSAEALFELGVARVVIGTAAIERPALVDDLCADGLRVAVGIDARGGEVATHGWTERTGQSVFDLADRFTEVGVDALVVTEISRDGTLEGPDVEGLSALLARTRIPLIASGGVGSVDHLAALASIRVSGATLDPASDPASDSRSGPDPIDPDAPARRSFDGVIVGRALYEGTFTVPEALAACTGSGDSLREVR